MIKQRCMVFLMWAMAIALVSPGYAHAEQARLENNRIALHFDAERGTLDALVQKETSVNLLSAPATLWQITLVDGSAITPGQAKHFGMEDGETSASRIFTWDDFGLADAPELRVVVRVSLAQEATESRWHIRVADTGSLSLRHVIFPRIDGFAVQEREVVAVPFWMGEYTTRARAVLNPENGAPGRRSWEYPGLLSLQCMAVYGSAAGVLMQTDDTTAARREFVLYGDGRGGLGMEILHAASAGSGNYEPPCDVLLNIFSGDWHTACTLYKNGREVLPYAGKSRVRNGSLPNWVDTTGLWIWNRGASPGVLAPALALQEAAGVPVSVFWHWWHGCAYDAGFPEYLPPREGAEPFRQALAQAQEQGVHAIVYMNQRLWGMETQSWQEKNAGRYAVKGPDGRIRPEVYNTFTKSPCASMCMGTPFWRDTYASIAEEALLRLGVDGIYMDQACSSLACYDPDHGHPPGGGPWWMEGFQLLAADIRRRCLPDKVPALAGEGCGEAWLPHLDLMLSLQVSMERYAAPGEWEPIPMFHAVYHDCARFFGNYCSLTRPPYDPLWPEATAPEKPLDLLDRKFAAQFRLEQARSFVWGQMPCIANFLPEHLDSRKEEMDFLLSLVRTRQAALKYLRDGIMLKPPEIDSPQIEIPISRLSIYAGQQDAVQEYTRKVPSLLASAWQAPDGAMAVALGNISEDSAPIRLRLAAPEYPLASSGVISRIVNGEREYLGSWENSQVVWEGSISGASTWVIEFVPAPDS